MYLRESKQRRADGSVVTYLQLAENTWNPEKRRAETRILCNCGRADDEAVIERLRRLANSILRRCSPEEIVAAGPDWRLVPGPTAMCMCYRHCGSAGASGKL